MKVANITMHAVNNYGSIFQTLATEHIFQQLGFEVETIDYIPERERVSSFWGIVTRKRTPVLLKLKMLAHYIMPKQNNRGQVMGEFRKKYLHITKTSYSNNTELEKKLPQADIYCTGSDQTWNTVCQGEVPLPYFLAFVPDEKKKIAFSASFGISEIPESDKQEVKRLLSRYHAISVREESGVKILNDLGLEGIQVLDPTIAVGSEFWENLATSRMFEDDYLLVYQLNRNPEFTKYIKKFAAINNLKIVQIRSRKDTDFQNGICLTDVKPEELLSLFKYSKKVITDSFHATVFSLMFHCDFMVIYPPRFTSRIESILNLTELQSRRISDMGRYDYSDVAIDYSKVDQVLDRERANTINFLRKAVL